MDRFNRNFNQDMAKAQEENDENEAIEEEMIRYAQRISEAENKRKILRGQKAARGKLGKHGGGPSSSGSQPTPKKPKLEESKTLDVAAPSQAEENASEKKKQKKVEINAPTTPPRTSKGRLAPGTPGTALKPAPNPSNAAVNSPDRRMGPYRGHYDLVYDPVGCFLANEMARDWLLADSDSSDSDTDEEFSNMDSSSGSQPTPKKPKLEESKTLDVAAPSQAEGNASKKKKKQVEIDAPTTPPRTSKGRLAPGTPGTALKPAPNPSNAAANSSANSPDNSPDRRMGPNRGHYDLVYDPVGCFLANEMARDWLLADSDSSDSDTDEEFPNMDAMEEAEGQESEEKDC